MLSFDFHCPTRIVCGAGKLAELGRLAATLGATRALVVSDPGIVAAGHAPRGVAALESAGIAVTLFDGVEENPTTDHVNAGLAMAKQVRPDLIVGLGGGSSMDCAKGINFLVSCGGRMRDYWGEGKATGPLLPMIAVPTTAGTGSETQSYALVADAKTHVKMACGDKRAAFRIAVLDPELTLTQPPRVTALTAVDALSHSLESFVTKRRNAISILFSREAWRYLAPNIERVLADPNDLESRSAMQIGACLAGLAIENSMLGAAHALANPLTSQFGLAHGEAIALMLPHVIRRNAHAVGAWYLELASTTPELFCDDTCCEACDGACDCEGGGERGEACGDECDGECDGSCGESCGTSYEDAWHEYEIEAAEEVAQFVGRVSRLAGLASTLTACGMSESDLPALAAAASQQWTGAFNPVAFSADDYHAIYQEAL
ncbi:MAG: iron-containing alcohol dehydrogenase [Pirellulales bacterium]|nr:iron-containing alcohol dehydrogenase [Pirellulales bacterium]